MDISIKLNELMTKSGGISRSKLAREIGVHTTTVSNWLDGKDPKPDNLMDLSRYFDVPAEYFSGASNQQKESPVPERKGDDRAAEFGRKLFSAYGGPVEDFEGREADIADIMKIMKKDKK